jgi:hypothetical protein
MNAITTCPPNRGKLPLAQFAPVKIIAHTDYDLIAEKTI